jgi:hypothetical protein
MTQCSWDKLFLKLSQQVIMELLHTALTCDIHKTYKSGYSDDQEPPPDVSPALFLSYLVGPFLLT